MNMFFRIVCYLWIIVIGLTSTATLGNAQTKRLDRMRAAYDGEIQRVTEPVDKKYGRALVELQQKLVGEDKLKEALVVKQEIENLKAKLLGAAVAAEVERAPMIVSTDADKEKTEEVDKKSVKSLKWDGDAKTDRVDGEVIYVLKADKNMNVFMSTKMKDPVETYPNGLRWRFEYMSEDYTGTGFEVKFDFPSLKVISRNGSAIRPNGQWIERTLPFSDLKGEDQINFQIHLTPGEGTVRFRNIELIPN